MTRISPSPPISFCYLFLHSYTGELEAVARALLSQPSARCVLTKGDPSQTLTSSQARSAMMDLLSLSLSLILIRPSTVRQLLILLQRTRSGGGGSIRPFSARYRIDRINEPSLLLSLSYSTSPTLFRGKLLAGSDRSKFSISTTTTSRGDEEKMHRGRPPTLLTEHPS